MTSDKTPLQTALDILNTLINNGQYDLLLQILSLLCLLSISTAPHCTVTPQLKSPSDGSENPLQKLLGELTKQSGTGPPDMLSTLLPLLSSPQIKAKLNPSNIASVMGMLNGLNLGGKQPPASKPTAKQPLPKPVSTENTNKKEEPVIKTTSSSDNQAKPSADQPLKQAEPADIKTTDTEAPAIQEAPPAPEAVNKTARPGSRFLKWKTNF